MSEFLKLDMTDWTKIGKGALIAFGGAFLFTLGEWLLTGEFNAWRNGLVSATSVGLNAAYKWLQTQE